MAWSNASRKTLTQLILPRTDSRGSGVLRAAEDARIDGPSDNTKKTAR
jgi:hypothetical protein